MVQAGTRHGWGAEHLSLQVKLLELQELVLRLVSERNEWQGKFLAAAQSPAAESTSSPLGPQELAAASEQDGE